MSDDQAATPGEASLWVFVLATGVLGLMALLVALPSGAREAAGLDREGWLSVLAFIAVFLFLQVNTFRLPWRGHRIAIVLDEAVIFVGLLVIAPSVLLLASILPVALGQRLRGKPAIKTIYNLGAHTLALGAGVLAFALIAPVATPVVGALAAVILYALGTNISVALVFARIEDGSAFDIFRDRCVGPTVFQSTLGGSGGLIFIALWSYHPLALLAFIPLAFLAREYARFRERAETVLLVHDRVERLRERLAAARDRESVADAALTTVGALVPAERARLMLLGEPGSDGRTWSKEFDRVAPDWEPLDTPIANSRGSLIGVLTVELAAREAKPEMRLALLRLVASEVGIHVERVDMQAAGAGTAFRVKH